MTAINELNFVSVDELIGENEPSTSSGVVYRSTLGNHLPADEFKPLLTQSSTANQSHNASTSNILTPSCIPSPHDTQMTYVWPYTIRLCLPIQPGFVIECACVKFVSPSLFWMQLQTCRAIQIDEFIQNAELQVLEQTPVRLEYVLGPHSTGSTVLLRRARVMQITKHRKSGEAMCRLLFIDWGQIGWATIESLRQMPLEGNIAHFPWQSVACSIHGLTPLNDVWSTNVIDEMRSFIQGKQLFISTPHPGVIDEDPCVQQFDPHKSLTYPIDLLARKIDCVEFSVEHVGLTLQLNNRKYLKLNRQQPMSQLRIFDVQQNVKKEMEDMLAMPSDSPIRKPDIFRIDSSGYQKCARVK